MPDKKDETFKAIEDTQAALRESIAEAADLAAKSERLIKKHRQEMSKDSKPAS